MSRLFSIMLGAVIAFSASSANAAFTFAFANPTITVTSGSSGSVRVNLAATGADSAPTLLGYSLNLTSSNPSFVFTNPFNGTPGSLAQAVVNFTTAPGLPNPTVTTVTGTFSYFSSATGFQSGTVTGPLQITAVPEPSSIALVGVCAVAGLVVNYRRRNKSKIA